MYFQIWFLREIYILEDFGKNTHMPLLFKCFGKTLMIILCIYIYID